MKEEIRKHFSNKFVELDSDRMILNGISVKSISSEDCLFLESPFHEEEIKEAILGCGSAKSSGADDFSFLLIKKCWLFLKEDLLHFLNHFHSGGVISKVVNSYFLTLVPKAPNSVSLEDYSPIFLVGCMYKVISKLLEGRLKTFCIRLFLREKVFSCQVDNFLMGFWW